MFSNRNNIGILDHKGYNKNPLTEEPYSKQYKIYSLTSAKPWSKLPMAKYRNEIIKKISENRVNIITAGTGAGKSVIVPKCALHTLDYKGKVVITVPKQMLARNSADWAAKVLDVELGKEVGFKHRNSKIGAGSEIEVKGKKIKVSQDRPSYDEDLTKLLYATDGTINATLLTDKNLLKPGTFDIIIIDEAHERSTQIDLLLYLSKNALRNNENLKVIVLSATIDTKLFSDYFDEFDPIVSTYSGAKPYKTELNFLTMGSQNYVKDGVIEIQKILTQRKTFQKRIFNEGAILMFVPTLKDAQKVCEELDTLKIEKNGYRPFCIELSGKSNDENKEYAIHIDKYKNAKDGPYTRKIVTATNVAESSITIDGAAYVIDSGYELSVRYNPFRDCNMIKKGRITKAQAKQRWGRVGRRDEGRIICLYSEKELKDFEVFPTPKILTQNLEFLLISLTQVLEPNIGEKFVNLKDVVDTLEEFITPPDPEFIEIAVDNLKLIGCLDDNQYFTPITDLLAILQINPRFGRIILESIAYGQKWFGIRAAAILSTCSSLESVVGITMPENLLDINSDVSSILAIYGKFLTFKTFEKQVQFCEEYKLNYNAFVKIRNVISIIEENITNVNKKLFMRDNIMKTLKMKNSDVIKFDVDEDRRAYLILSGTIMNLSKKLKQRNFRNCVPNIIDSFGLGSSFIQAANIKYLVYGSITVINNNINFGLFTGLTENVIKYLRQNLSYTYISCLEQEGYTKEDLEVFRQRLQITNDFNDDHVPELNITELKNFVSSKIDTDWSLFWPLYISPDLTILPRLSQLLRQFNRDTTDIGTLQDDLIFGTEIISSKASDTINLIKIVTGSYETLLKKYNEKLEEVETKEKAIDSLRENLESLKGQVITIIPKLQENKVSMRDMQLKLNTLEEKNKDETYAHTQLLKSIINLDKVILPKTENTIERLNVQFNKKKDEYLKTTAELEKKQEEVQIVEDALKMMKAKLNNIMLIKGGGMIVENITHQLGGSIRKPLKMKIRAVLKPLSNNKIVFTSNEKLFKNFDNQEIITLLYYNNIKKQYITTDDREQLTALLKLLILAKLEKINNKDQLIDFGNRIKYIKLKGSIEDMKKILSNKIKF